jgi:hypothetical protein
MDSPEAAPVRNAVPFNKVAIVSTYELNLTANYLISSHRLQGRDVNLRSKTTSRFELKELHVMKLQIPHFRSPNFESRSKAN